MDLRPFNVMSFCTGAGGLDRGIKLAVPTARTVCLVEREAYCCELLASRMEEGGLDDSPIWSDLWTFDGRPWRGVVDCVAGGYPCQPFSLAGRRGGVNDPRHLWPRIRELVEQAGPERCFFENVPGHLSLGFEEVAQDLEGLGYRVAAGLFTASEVGASHKRERLFIMAHSECGRRDGLYERHEPGHVETDVGGDGFRLFSGITRGEGREGGREGALAPGSLVHATSVGWGEGRPEHEFRCGRDPAAVAGLPVWPPGPNDIDAWGRVLERRPDLAPAVESNVRRVADGLAPRVDRLRACGNGVVPRQAALAWHTLTRSLMEAS